ncbi:hypothetical protein SNE40_020635 [Patella caerulea]|uniref:Uncharacterized protein n=1 Tax=Patella caerulea TaxID=87958 RepID=A0AAN8P3G9_PATCE
MFLNFHGKLAVAFMTASIAAMVEDSKINVACYGVTGLSCTQHHLTCSNTSTILITNITLGYRQGCGRDGLSNCGNITCCTEETGDCFLNVTNLPLKQHDCLNKSTCTTRGLRKAGKVCNGAPISAYSKIVYKCIPANTQRSTSTAVFTSLTANHTLSTSPPATKILPTPSSTTKEILPSPPSTTKEIIPSPPSTTTGILPNSPSTTTEKAPTSLSSTTAIPPTPDNLLKTDTSNNGGIVGGLIGALLVLVAIGLIGLYLFKRKQRKRRIAPTCVHNNLNATTNCDYITAKNVENRVH